MTLRAALPILFLAAVAVSMPTDYVVPETAETSFLQTETHRFHGAALAKMELLQGNNDLCKELADADINSTTATITTTQEGIDAEDDGSSCLATWTTASGNRAGAGSTVAQLLVALNTATTTATTATTTLVSISQTNVCLGYDSITSYESITNTASYTIVHTQYQAQLAIKTAADQAVVTAQAVYDQAVQDAAAYKASCYCSVQERNANDWSAAQQVVSATSILEDWAVAHHILCVLKGADSCIVPSIPALQNKALTAEAQAQTCSAPTAAPTAAPTEAPTKAPTEAPTAPPPTNGCPAEYTTCTTSPNYNHPQSLVTPGSPFCDKQNDCTGDSNCNVGSQPDVDCVIQPVPGTGATTATSSPTEAPTAPPPTNGCPAEYTTCTTSPNYNHPQSLVTPGSPFCDKQNDCTGDSNCNVGSQPDVDCVIQPVPGTGATTATSSPTEAPTAPPPTNGCPAEYTTCTTSPNYNHPQSLVTPGSPFCDKQNDCTGDSNCNVGSQPDVDCVIQPVPGTGATTTTSSHLLEDFPGLVCASGNSWSSLDPSGGNTVSSDDGTFKSLIPGGRNQPSITAEQCATLALADSDCSSYITHCTPSGTSRCMDKTDMTALCMCTRANGPNSGCSGRDWTQGGHMGGTLSSYRIG